MSSDIAIKVENISKCYQIYKHPQDRLKQSIYSHLPRFLKNQSKQYYREFWALQDISFEIKKGETVGIIGANGSGKSTLLQIICGTLNPTSGSLHTNGRIAALLELGSGFNPEFTGRENVYLNAAILGLSQTEIESKLDNILGFADIGDFLDQPVKTYSSGMFVRLAFSVNIMSDPEIMVVDEALAVGDMQFQAKCITALKRIQDNGATILFVSHDIDSVKSLCSRGIYLEKGITKMIGSAQNVAEKYIQTTREEFNESQQHLKPKENIIKTLQNTESSIQMYEGKEFKSNKDLPNTLLTNRYGNGEARINRVDMVDIDNVPIKFVEFNQHVKIKIYFESFIEKALTVNFIIFDEKKINITGGGFLNANQQYLKILPGDQYLAEYSLSLPLKEGNYSIRAQIAMPVIKNVSSVFLDVIDDVVVFRMNKWQKVALWSKVHLFPSLEIKKIRTVTKKNDYSSDNHVFIIGTGRCGTTMLARMLNAHSKLCVPPELQILFESSGNGERFYEAFTSGKTKNWHADDFINRFQEITPHKFDKFFDYEHFFRQQNYPITNLQALLNNLYHKIASNKGKEIFVEQTPWYGQRIDLLKQMFPNARFIHMIRDGRDVALSFSRTPWWHDSPLDNLELWQKQISKIRKDAKLHLSDNQYLEINYEDFVFDAEKGLRRICDFLSLKYEIKMLSPKNHIDYRIFSKKPDSSIDSDAYRNWNKKREKAVFSDNVYGWKKTSKQLFLSMSDRTRSTLKEFGYDSKLKS